LSAFVRARCAHRMLRPMAPAQVAVEAGKRPLATLEEAGVGRTEQRPPSPSSLPTSRHPPPAWSASRPWPSSSLSSYQPCIDDRLRVTRFPESVRGVSPTSCRLLHIILHAKPSCTSLTVGYFWTKLGLGRPILHFM
jgi:hypothetical protein